MHAYRTHNCGALRAADAGKTARLSGWVHRKRDHGGLLFIDLRDHFGLTQIVLPSGSESFAIADGLRVESVITVTGEVVLREPATVNPKLPTGGIEIRVKTLEVQSAADVLPRMNEGAYDIVFIDADSENVIEYVEHGLRLVRAGGTVLVPRVLAGGAVADPVRRGPVESAFRSLIQETQSSPAVLGALSIVGEGLLQLTTVATEG